MKKEEEKEGVNGDGNQGGEPTTIGWHEAVKTAYPDRAFESDDDLNNGASELFEQYKNEVEEGRTSIAKAKEVNQKLIEVFEQYPDIAGFLDDVLKGASPEVAIARNFDMDSIQPQDGDPDYEAWNTALNERKERSAASTKFQEELDANKVESSKVFDQFAEKQAMDEAAMDEFLAEIDAFLGDIYRGRVTIEFLESILVAKNHDSDMKKAKAESDAAIEAARKEGEVEGRNKKIDATKTKKKDGDGIPRVSSSGDKKEGTKKKDYMDGVLENYKRRKRV